MSSSLTRLQGVQILAQNGQKKLGPLGFTKAVYLVAQINVLMIFGGLKVVISNI